MTQGGQSEYPILWPKAWALTQGRPVESFQWLMCRCWESFQFSIEIAKLDVGCLPLEHRLLENITKQRQAEAREMITGSTYVLGDSGLMLWQHYLCSWIKLCLDSWFSNYLSQWICLLLKLIWVEYLLLPKVEDLTNTVMNQWTTDEIYPFALGEG